ncbi:hypothetical protein LXT21_44185 [Myxococcus sp. K38C18041901]|uniref:hypothetical protein n=1 Tax=Myxococcus guangdongensis TaxID=2906760 RepID=UPI0020A82304|nr:hypothetical protein [Myxococcus guangdongensis]MCP3065789.1 hypothetical protein [Myxococcus guangdongensis]
MATMAANAAAIFSVLRDASPQIIVGIAASSSLIALSFPAAYITRRIRTHRQHLATMRMEQERLTSLSNITNKALALTMGQLSPWRSESTTAIHIIKHILHNFDKAAPSELQLHRDIIQAGCEVFRYLPDCVTPEQCMPISRIMDEAVHKLVRDLPRFIADCEQAASLMNDSRAGYVLEQTAILRDRINHMLTAYTALATSARDIGVNLLVPFEAGEHLRAPQSTRLLSQGR